MNQKIYHRIVLDTQGDISRITPKYIKETFDVVCDQTFSSMEDYVDYIELVNNDENLWRSYAESPLLLKKPNIDQVVRVLKQALKPLGLD